MIEQVCSVELTRLQGIIYNRSVSKQSILLFMFRSYDDNDEMCWAGAWLYMATHDEHFLKVAEKFYEGGAAWGNSWDEKNSGCMVRLNLNAWTYTYIINESVLV